jgi:transposase InsO family protein
MDQRLEFISDCLRRLWPMSDLCARYGISRPTGYKWVARYEAEGPAGLLERSRRPHCSPNATAPEVVEALLAERRSHQRWGAKKLLALLHSRHPDMPWLAVSTAQLILKRHGLVRSRRRRRHRPVLAGARSESSAPNDVWTADFKGEFRTGDGRYCYPLTIVDDHSRYLLACRGLLEVSSAATQATFARLFRHLGLPRVIRTDNGTPFAGKGLARLSRLAVWWIQLGITPELIAPARPEQNGRHERLHRTLKEATALPPAASARAQQGRFDRFREEYNFHRPHEALGQVVPASVYEPSPRAWPELLPPVSYPGHFQLRRVGSNGCIRWYSRPVFVSFVLEGECIGLEELAPGVWDVYFGPRRLGVFTESESRIEDVSTLTPPS